LDDRPCSGIRDNGKIPSLSFLEFSSVAGWTDLGQSAGDFISGVAETAISTLWKLDFRL
jgi:hypothetical protein